LPPISGDIPEETSGKENSSNCLESDGDEREAKSFREEAKFFEGEMTEPQNA